MLEVPELDELRLTHPRAYRGLVRLIAAVNKVANDAGVDPVDAPLAPPAPSMLTVTQANGVFIASITESAANLKILRPAIRYFLEFSTSLGPNEKWLTEPLHAARTWTRYLGAATYYFRCYSAYQGSRISPIVYFGGSAAPTAVVGAGSAPPALPPGTGSGTSGSGGGGFGGGRGGGGKL
jgi:uncharacterized membrane protein YgcG